MPCLLFAALCLLTACTPKHHTATAMIQLLREDPGGAIAQEDGVTLSAERIQLAVGILESNTLSRAVVVQLMQDGKAAAFMEPYGAEASETALLEKLHRYRTIRPQRMSLLLSVSYAHPDAEMAADVANLIARAFLDYELARNIDSALKPVEDLRVRLDQQRERVEKIEVALAQAKQSGDTTSETYKSLTRDLEVQKQFRDALSQRMGAEKTQIQAASTARIVDQAIAPSN